MSTAGIAYILGLAQGALIVGLFSMGEGPFSVFLLTAIQVVCLCLWVGPKRLRGECENG